MRNNIEGFYGGVFSQWYKSPIVIDNGEWASFLVRGDTIEKFYDNFDIEEAPYKRTFNCAEQAMMFGKAIMFGDVETAYKILEKKHPSDHKKLGRKVKNFEEGTWNAHKFALIVMINKHKFSQKKELQDYLESTGHALIVEMSPTDNIWGIGLDATDEDAWDVSKWKGENLLGRAIMVVREKLRTK